MLTWNWQPATTSSLFLKCCMWPIFMDFPMLTLGDSDSVYVRLNHETQIYTSLLFPKFHYYCWFIVRQTLAIVFVCVSDLANLLYLILLSMFVCYCCSVWRIIFFISVDSLSIVFVLVSDLANLLYLILLLMFVCYSCSAWRIIFSSVLTLSLFFNVLKGILL